MKKAAMVMSIVIAIAGAAFAYDGLIKPRLSQSTGEVEKALREARQFRCNVSGNRSDNLSDVALVQGVLTWGRHKSTGATYQFPSPCLPPGWEHAGTGPAPN